MDDNQDMVSEAFAAAEQAPFPTNLQIADGLLSRMSGDVGAHFLMGQMATRAGLSGLGAAMYRNVANMAPTRPEPWHNMSKTAQIAQRYDEAAGYLSHAIALDPASAESIYNLAAIRLQQGRPEEALALADTAVELNPDLATLARETSSLANLALGNWTKGWADYDEALNGDFRLRKTYHKNIQAWAGPDGGGDPGPLEYFEDGERPFATDFTTGGASPLIVHTEQGIGDEVLFSSMLDDLAPLSGKVDMILDCDPRMVGLFRRSFPHMKVYGTRRDIQPHWLEDRSYDVSAIASLGKFYRLSDDAFPGTPYLTPCPTRTFQWKSLLASAKRRPVIGLAWTGGRAGTGDTIKSTGLATFAPLFAAFPDAMFVNLEYKDRSGYIEAVNEHFDIDIMDAPWATMTNDYDDTAALVYACDAVVSVMTSVAHLSAALGVPTHMMLPTQPQPIWRYYRRARHPVWYKSMTLHRQDTPNDWRGPVDSIVSELKTRFPQT